MGSGLTFKLCSALLSAWNALWCFVVKILPFQGSEPPQNLAAAPIIISICCYLLIAPFVYMLSFLPISTVEETEVQSGNLPKFTPRQQRLQISNLHEPDSKPHTDPYCRCLLADTESVWGQTELLLKLSWVGATTGFLQAKFSKHQLKKKQEIEIMVLFPGTVMRSEWDASCKAISTALTSIIKPVPFYLATEVKSIMSVSPTIPPTPFQQKLNLVHPSSAG